MPKVNHVKKARKTWRGTGIKKGDEYYWWKFAFGPVCRSKTPPRRAQLTRSDFLSQLYDIQDGMEDRFIDPETFEEDRDGLVEELQGMQEECQERLDNMPPELQETAPSAVLLQERIENLEQWIDAIQSIDCDDVDNDAEKNIIWLNMKIAEIMENDPF